MHSSNIELQEIKLIGLATRTSLAKEMDPANAKIPTIIQQYFHEITSAKVLHRKNPGVTFGVYTEYESDFMGEYTYFFGEEVSAFEDIPDGFKMLTIPPQIYTKFTTDAGPMPGIVIGAWQEIWNMSPEMLGGERRYLTDFEKYDERSADPQKTIVDLYIGIQK